MTRPRLVLIGMKGSGKSTVGRALAERLQAPFIDLDRAIEQRYAGESGNLLSVRAIFQQHGADAFRALETLTLEGICEQAAGGYVLATGGGTPLAERNRALLRQIGKIIFLNTTPDILRPRLAAQGPSPIFSAGDPERSLQTLLAERQPVYAALADVTLMVGTEPPERLAARILDLLGGR